MLTDTYRLSLADDYNPRGPDGQGRNRLRIEYFPPTDRCGLRPETTAAALDLLRGVLHQTEPTAFGACAGVSCAECCRPKTTREPWSDEWIVREDGRGHLWLLGKGRGWDSYGYFFRGWSDLIEAIAVPKLRQDHDQHGSFYRAARKGE